MSAMINHIQRENNFKFNKVNNKNKLSNLKKQPKHLNDQLNIFLSEYFPKTKNNELILNSGNVSIIKTTTMERIRNLEKQTLAEEVMINDLQTEKKEKLTKVLFKIFYFYKKRI